MFGAWAAAWILCVPRRVKKGPEAAVGCTEGGRHAAWAPVRGSARSSAAPSWLHVGSCPACKCGDKERPDKPRPQTQLDAFSCQHVELNSRLAFQTPPFSSFFKKRFY